MSGLPTVQGPLKLGKGQSMIRLENDKADARRGPNRWACIQPKPQTLNPKAGWAVSPCMPLQADGDAAWKQAVHQDRWICRSLWKGLGRRALSRQPDELTGSRMYSGSALAVGKLLLGILTGWAVGCQLGRRSGFCTPAGRQVGHRHSLLPL